MRFPSRPQPNVVLFPARTCCSPQAWSFFSYAQRPSVLIHIKRLFPCICCRFYAAQFSMTCSDYTTAVSNFRSVPVCFRSLLTFLMRVYFFQHSALLFMHASSSHFDVVSKHASGEPRNIRIIINSIIKYPEISALI